MPEEITIRSPEAVACLELARQAIEGANSSLTSRELVRTYLLGMGHAVGHYDESLEAEILSLRDAIKKEAE